MLFSFFNEKKMNKMLSMTVIMSMTQNYERGLIIKISPVEKDI